MICKGQDRCLFVFPVTEFARFTDALRNAPVTDRRVRDYGRVLFASASHETPDSQGRITVPASLRQYAGLSKDCVVIGANSPHRGMGRRGLAELPRRNRAGLRRHRRGGPARRPLIAPIQQPTFESGLLPSTTWHTFPGARRDGRGPDRTSDPPASDLSPTLVAHPRPPTALAHLASDDPTTTRTNS